MINNLQKFIENAENGISKIDDFIKKMDGMSGLKTRHFYNNLLSLKDVKYLEVGVWKGSSVCSAMCGNSAEILCIDNWSEFGGPKNEFLYNIEKYRGNNKISYIESDCFKVDRTNLGIFNIFMYDGNHTYDSHYNALPYFINNMTDEFIYIIDDWNWIDVRESTNKSISDLNLKVLWSYENLINEDNTTTHDREGWWNGISVFLLKK